MNILSKVRRHIKFGKASRHLRSLICGEGSSGSSKRVGGLAAKSSYWGFFLGPRERRTCRPYNPVRAYPNRKDPRNSADQSCLAMARHLTSTNQRPEFGRQTLEEFIERGIAAELLDNDNDEEK